MSPARIVRIISAGCRLYDHTYALDETGELWSFERDEYRMVWVRLPHRTVADLYMHVEWDNSECGGVSTISVALRVLDIGGALWQLRYISYGRDAHVPGEYVWDAVSLEAR